MAASFLGYPVPVEYSAGLEVGSVWFTVEYDGSTYAALAAVIPFTTTAAFDASKWQLIQGVTATDLSASSGAAMVGLFVGGTVADAISYVTLEMLGGGVGAVDNSVALQRFADYIAKGGTSTLVLGTGEYRLASNVTFSSAVTIRGAGGMIDSNAGDGR